MALICNSICKFRPFESVCPLFHNDLSPFEGNAINISKNAEKQGTQCHKSKGKFLTSQKSQHTLLS